MVNKKQEQTQSSAVLSLISGIGGIILFLVPFLNIFLSIMAVVFYAQQKRNSDNAMATIGLILGVIGIFLNGLVMLFFTMLAGA